VRAKVYMGIKAVPIDIRNPENSQADILPLAHLAKGSSVGGWANGDVIIPMDWMISLMLNPKINRQ